MWWRQRQRCSACRTTPPPPPLPRYPHPPRPHDEHAHALAFREARIAPRSTRPQKVRRGGPTTRLPLPHLRVYIQAAPHARIKSSTGDAAAAARHCTTPHHLPHRRTPLCRRTTAAFSGSVPHAHAAHARTCYTLLPSHQRYATAHAAFACATAWFTVPHPRCCAWPVKRGLRHYSVTTRFLTRLTIMFLCCLPPHPPAFLLPQLHACRMDRLVDGQIPYYLYMFLRI